LAIERNPSQLNTKPKTIPRPEKTPKTPKANEESLIALLRDPLRYNNLGTFDKWNYLPQIGQNPEGFQASRLDFLDTSLDIWVRWGTSWPGGRHFRVRRGTNLAGRVTSVSTDEWEMVTSSDRKETSVSTEGRERAPFSSEGRHWSLRLKRHAGQRWTHPGLRCPSSMSTFVFGVFSLTCNLRQRSRRV
jgi:hypothetical protein